MQQRPARRRAGARSVVRVPVIVERMLVRHARLGSRGARLTVPCGHIDLQGKTDRNCNWGEATFSIAVAQDTVGITYSIAALREIETNRDKPRFPLRRQQTRRKKRGLSLIYVKWRDER
jgi:hypothetical protein